MGVSWENPRLWSTRLPACMAERLPEPYRGIYWRAKLGEVLAAPSSQGATE